MEKCSEHCEHGLEWMRGNECMFMVVRTRGCEQYCGHECPVVVVDRTWKERAAIEAMLSAMEIQEGREREELHITTREAKHVWDEAKKLGREALGLPPDHKPRPRKRPKSGPVGIEFCASINRKILI